MVGTGAYKYMALRHHDSQSRIRLCNIPQTILTFMYPEIKYDYFSVIYYNILSDMHTFRNNKLTMLMQDSLGGNAKTLMFVNISPADYNSDETVTSLT